MARMMRRAKERLEARGVKNPQAANLTIALPILHAAADESREELQALWAKLLANAMDPSRVSRVRGAFIEVAKRLEPLDAAVLSNVQERGGGHADGNVRNTFAALLKVSRDEVDVSVENLVSLRLLKLTHPPDAVIDAFGREFLRAVED
jgi:hypothetical protein